MSSPKKTINNACSKPVAPGPFSSRQTDAPSSLNPRDQGVFLPRRKEEKSFEFFRNDIFVQFGMHGD